MTPSNEVGGGVYSLIIHLYLRLGFEYNVVVKLHIRTCLRGHSHDQIYDIQEVNNFYENLELKNTQNV